MNWIGKVSDRRVCLRLDITTVVLRLKVGNCSQIYLNGTSIFLNPVTGGNGLIIKSNGTGSVFTGVGYYINSLTTQYPVGFLQGINTMTFVSNGVFALFSETFGHASPL